MKQNEKKGPMTAADSLAPITNYEYDLKSNLAFGGSEGIYLDLWMVHYVGGERHADGVGTFKTLRENHETMHWMAALLADFIFEETDYVNANLDDFTWGARHAETGRAYSQACV